MKRVLVLGSTGMLGHTVVAMLRRDPSLEVTGTTRRELDAERPDFSRFQADYIVNAIGVLRAQMDDANPASVARATRVNAVFPHELAAWASSRGACVVHFSTDAVFANERETCFEDSTTDATDLYGRSKALGEPRADTCLVLRGSIVGHDPLRHRGLLEWLLSQPEGGTVKGFTNQSWQGVTTKQFAELCRRIFAEDRFDELRRESWVHHLCVNRPTTKHDLLCTFRDVLGKRVTIVPHEGPPVRRVLATHFRGIESVLGRDLDIADAIRDMKE